MSTVLKSADEPRKPVKLWILSDLHLNVRNNGFTSAVPDADIAIVAGDVTEGISNSLEWLAEFVRPHMDVVFVAGNHEFYGTCLPQEIEQGRRLAKNLSLHYLDGDAVVIHGLRFIGATLWTDYMLFGEDYQVAAMNAARWGLMDHRLINRSKEPWLRFQPDDAQSLHLEASAFIDKTLAQPFTGRTIVVTHHAPHPSSIAPAFKGDLLSAAFASDLTGLIERNGPDLWIHGHTHHCVDYKVGKTRIVSNAKGYPGEKTGFDPSFILEIQP